MQERSLRLRNAVGWVNVPFDRSREEAVLMRLLKCNDVAICAGMQYNAIHASGIKKGMHAEGGEQGALTCMQKEESRGV